MFDTECVLTLVARGGMRRATPVIAFVTGHGIIWACWCPTVLTDGRVRDADNRITLGTCVSVFVARGGTTVTTHDGVVCTQDGLAMETFDGVVDTEDIPTLIARLSVGLTRQLAAGCTGCDVIFTIVAITMRTGDDMGFTEVIPTV